MLMRKKNPERLPGSFFLINTTFFIYFFRYETIETYTCAFFMVIIFSISGVDDVIYERRSVLSVYC
jgi:hypothetical protein